MSRWKFLPIILLAPFALQACPPGTVPQQGTGWQGCAPVPGTGASAPPRSEHQDIWMDRWGAIVVDTSPRGSIGFTSATDMKNKAQAEKAALKSCRKKGGAKCEVVIAYYNQCAVLIWGDRTISTSGAPSEAQAKQRGIDKCTRADDTNCELVYSGCSLPQHVR